MVQLYDRLTFDRTARICADGCLVAEVFAARTGLQDYAGYEVDPDNAHGLKDRAVVKVYRPESEVFKADSLATFAAAPVTVDHPSTPVTADNWRALGVGEINGDVVRDGQRVRVPIIVRDAAAVQAATSTHKQLSMGYATNLVFPADGRHPDGTACDAYQTDLRINHIALVRAARGGPELRVIDERPGHTPPNGDMHMKTLTIDGLRVPNVSDEAEAAINKILADNAGLTTKVADAATKAAADATAMAAKDTEIAALKQQIADAKLTPAQLRDAARAYAQTVEAAKALGVTIADNADAAAIMKAVVDAKMGDAAKDWTADQIAASFAVLARDAKPAAPALAVHNIAPAQSFGDAAAAVAVIRDARYA